MIGLFASLKRNVTVNDWLLSQCTCIVQTQICIFESNFHSARNLLSVQVKDLNPDSMIMHIVICNPITYAMLDPQPKFVDQCRLDKSKRLVTPRILIIQSNGASLTGETGIVLWGFSAEGRREATSYSHDFTTANLWKKEKKVPLIIPCITLDLINKTYSSHFDLAISTAWLVSLTQCWTKKPLILSGTAFRTIPAESCTHRYIP